MGRIRVVLVAAGVGSVWVLSAVNVHAENDYVQALGAACDHYNDARAFAEAGEGGRYRYQIVVARGMAEGAIAAAETDAAAASAGRLLDALSTLDLPRPANGYALPAEPLSGTADDVCADEPGWPFV